MNKLKLMIITLIITIILLTILISYIKEKMQEVEEPIANTTEEMMKAMGDWCPDDAECESYEYDDDSIPTEECEDYLSPTYWTWCWGHYESNESIYINCIQQCENNHTFFTEQYICAEQCYDKSLHLTGCEDYDKEQQEKKEACERSKNITYAQNDNDSYCVNDECNILRGD